MSTPKIRTNQRRDACLLCFLMLAAVTWRETAVGIPLEEIVSLGSSASLFAWSPRRARRAPTLFCRANQGLGTLGARHRFGKATFQISQAF
jgi:hypothetical protein